MALIEELERRGLAYAAGGDVYFRVAAFPGYGELSGQRVDELVAGARIEPGEAKESPADFALWKAIKPGEDRSWPSPWGPGRPGWHIECSAMAQEHLGTGFDVHGGGLDLVFPHHENERAQSEGAGAHPFTRCWMHNGMLRLSDEKMSKSRGNVERLHDALGRVGRETLLAYFAGASYRMPIDYHERALEQAAAVADRFREALRNARRYARSGSGTNAHVAESGSHRRRALRRGDGGRSRHARGARGAARARRRAERRRRGRRGRPRRGRRRRRQPARRALGARPAHARPGCRRGRRRRPTSSALADEREAARAARDFARSDELRDEIARRGYTVRDTAQGPDLVPRDAPA